MSPITLERCGLAVLVGLSIITLLILQRGETFKGDELGYAVRVSPLGDGFFVPPVGKYMIPLPLLVYRGLFETVGLGSYLPYQLTAIAFVVICGVLLYLLARPRIGPLALAPAAIVLFFGSATEVTAAGALRLPDLMSVAAGLGMILALERRTLAGDLLGALLLAASLFSHPAGLAFVGAAAVLIVSRPGPDRWRRLWVFVVPASTWVVVWLSVRPSTGPSSGPLEEVPGFMLRSLVAVTSAITGLTRYVNEAPSDNHIGWALAALLVAGIAAAVWIRLRRRNPPPATFWAVLAALVVLWAVTALAPGGNRFAEAGRYMFPGGVLMLLVLVELADRVRVPAWTSMTIATVAVVSLILNADQLRIGAGLWRDWSDYIRAEETSLDLARGRTSADFAAEDPNARPWVGDHRMILEAWPYYVISSLWGSPAYTPEELAERPPNVRWAADVVLARALRLRLRDGGAKPNPDARPPTVSAISGGRVASRRNCAVLRPVGARLSADLLAPKAGIWIRGTGGATSLALRRFAPFAAYPLGRLPGDRSRSLTIPGDSAPPWTLSVRAHRPVTACTRH